MPSGTELENFSDENLIMEIQKGSHLAFSTLITRHVDKFYRIAFRIICNKENAEDITQEAFTKLWENPHKWQEKKKTKFTTWFYKIVVNLALESLLMRAKTNLKNKVKNWEELYVLR